MATQAADAPPRARARGAVLALKKSLRKPRLLRPAAVSLKSQAAPAAAASRT